MPLQTPGDEQLARTGCGQMLLSGNLQSLNGVKNSQIKCLRRGFAGLNFRRIRVVILTAVRDLAPMIR